MKLKLGIFIGLVALALMFIGCETESAYVPPSDTATQVVLQIQNFTDYYVTIYIDDSDWGVLNPFTKDSVNVSYGSHKLFAKASGTNIVWGPRYIDDTDYYTWNLRE
jgi:hypothetical protein